MPTPTDDAAYQSLSAEQAAKRVMRDVRLGTAARVGLVLLALAAAGAEAVPGVALRGTPTLLVGVLWVALALRSVKGARLLIGVGPLIAAGEYAAAEPRVAAAVRAFSVLKAPKLRALEHLALLRHAEKRFRDSASLCQTALRLSAGKATLELMLGEAALETNDLSAAHGVITRLHRLDTLTPREELKLLELQLDYGARVRAWPVMLEHLPIKLHRLEHLPTPAAARAQAFLALAARKQNHPDLADWLRRRVLLLADAPQLITSRPVLAELFA